MEPGGLNPVVQTTIPVKIHPPVEIVKIPINSAMEKEPKPVHQVNGVQRQHVQNLRTAQPLVMVAHVHGVVIPITVRVVQVV